jgi:hypothetical protein
MTFALRLSSPARSSADGAGKFPTREHIADREPPERHAHRVARLLSDTQRLLAGLEPLAKRPVSASARDSFKRVYTAGRLAMPNRAWARSPCRRRKFRWARSIVCA